MGWVLDILWFAAGLLVGSRKPVIGGVQIHDRELANDPVFVEDLAQACKRALERQIGWDEPVLS